MDGKIYDVYYYFFANIVVLGKFMDDGEQVLVLGLKMLKIANIVFDSNLTFG